MARVVMVTVTVMITGRTMTEEKKIGSQHMLLPAHQQLQRLLRDPLRLQPQPQPQPQPRHRHQYLPLAQHPY